MKKFLPLLFLASSVDTFAQVNFSMPPEANSFYNNAMQKIKPGIKNMIIRNAYNLKGRQVNTDSLFTQLEKETVLKNGSKENVQAVTVLIMIQVSKNADADLKNLVINMPKNKEPNETAENAQSKVASILANKSEIAESVSIAMKRILNSQETLLDNLK